MSPSVVLSQVVDTYGELFRSNPLLLQTVSDETITLIVRCLKSTMAGTLEGARFLDLLSMLCVYSDTPIPANQSRIVEHFLYPDFAMLGQLRLGSDGPEFSLSPSSYHDGASKGNGTETKALPSLWLSLATIEALPKQREGVLECLCKEIQDNSVDEKTFRFHYQSLRLFTYLCLGRNRTAIDFLLKHGDVLSLRYPLMLQMVQRTELPAIYRAVLCRLMVALFIDRGASELQLWTHATPVLCCKTLVR